MYYRTNKAFKLRHQYPGSKQIFSVVPTILHNTTIYSMLLYSLKLDNSKCFSSPSVMRFIIDFCLVILRLHVGDEIDDTVGVTHFIVIPGKIFLIVCSGMW